MSTATSQFHSRALWTTQVLLALLFIFAGATKFVLPVSTLQQGPVVLPLGFLYFIGVCEVAGGLGLVLPGLTGIHPYLTYLAAAGLTIIMIGAVTVSVIGMGAAAGLFPGGVGLLTAWITYSRVRVVPLAARQARPAA